MPIYCATGLSVQEAMNKAVIDLQESRHRFDTAVSILRAEARRDAARFERVMDWTDGCKALCIGNLTWR